MDAKLTKSLTDLIDETLQELDELRKSRFAATEIKIEGPGDGIAGKPSDGALDAKKADKEIHVDIDSHKEEEDEDDDKDEKDDMDKGENECAKADPTADPADSEATKRKLKSLMSKKEDDDKDEPHKDDPEHEEKEKKMAQKLLDMHKGEMKKSLESTESLMKSYVEERVKPLEDKLSTILDLVNKIADQPAPAKGVTYKAAPLLKSGDEGAGEVLSKAQVATKLFELKKSGTRVDSLDIAKAEMGQDLANIMKKYEIS